MNTTKKSIYNILFGVLGQLVTIAFGVILPRLFLTSYGSETNGFLSSIGQLFAYMTLLEAGVGAATVQALYGPIGRGERDRISGIISATNKFYKRTGYIYGACVLVLAVGFPFVIPSDIPHLTQIGIILLLGGSGVLNYFFQAKYRLLLQAEGKQYVLANITTVIHLLTSLTKIILIYLGLNIIWLQVAHLLFTFGQIAYYAYYIKKHYSWLNVKAAPDEQAISQKGSALIHQLAQMVFNHTDVLILTVFTNLKIVSVYVIYSTLVDMISTLIGNINTGFVFKLGQIYNTDKPRYKRIFDVYETYYMALSFALYAVTYMFLMPFMRLYTAGITDANYLLEWLPLMFVTYKAMVCGRAACGQTITFAGHFKKTQWRSVAETAINLITSIVAVILCDLYWGNGIYGVLVGTIIALLYRSNDMVIYTNKYLLERSCWQTYKKWIINIALTVGMILLFNHIPNKDLSSYWLIILWAAGTVVVVLIAFFTVNSLLDRRSYLQIKDVAKEIITSRLKRGGAKQ